MPVQRACDLPFDELDDRVLQPARAWIYAADSRDLGLRRIAGTHQRLEIGERNIAQEHAVGMPRAHAPANLVDHGGELLSFLVHVFYPIVPLWGQTFLAAGGLPAGWVGYA